MESLTQDEHGVHAEVVDDDGHTVSVSAQYALGCDGANGPVRRSLGVRYAGRSDDRPNFDLVFRAPGLSTPLGDAVQYWVVGERPAVVGRLDLDGMWWAIAPGVDAATGQAQADTILEGLVGQRSSTRSCPRTLGRPECWWQAHLGGPALAATIQRDKRAEFHSLGLVLGYSYAGSPAVQPVPVATEADPIEYQPSNNPGSLLPHAWLADGTSLYNVLGRGLSLVGPVGRAPEEVARLERDAADLGIPLTVVAPPMGYPWGDAFVLVRPDQHIAARASSPLGLDLRLAVGRPAGGASSRFSTPGHRRE